MDAVIVIGFALAALFTLTIFHTLKFLFRKQFRKVVTEAYGKLREPGIPEGELLSLEIQLKHLDTFLIGEELLQYRRDVLSQIFIQSQRIIQQRNDRSRTQRKA